MKTITMPIQTLRGFLEQIFIAAGCDSENAHITADGMIEADLRGHRIQGTDHMYSVVADLRAGRLNGRAQPRIKLQSPATALVDGDGASGHVAGRFAVDIAIDKARKAGVAAVGLIRCGDIYMVGAFVERITGAGLVGLTFTNTFPTWVHPAGGLDPMLGTNAMGFGFPVSDQDPVIVDLATSASAVGHVRLASYQNEQIPEGIAIDKDGQPTTDAKRALEGAMKPLGGHKGFGLGLACALLSGPLIGGVLGRKLKEQMTSCGQIPQRGHLFLAIDPAAFGGMETYLTQTKQCISDIKLSRKAPGVEEILIPGERSARKRRHSLANGVELREDVWQHTIEIGRTLGIEPPT
jgi:LDH2 family malate/lactate/ureidoglycolate dehydrogenase